MEVNQVNTLLPASVTAQMPPDVRAKLAAAMMAQERASAPSAPYTSRTAGLLKALQGGIGGLMQSSAIQQAMDGQKQANGDAMEFLRQYQQGQGQGQGGQTAAPSSAGSSAASSSGQGGVGSDHVAYRNPAGYDPKAVEALIRQRAPAYGIDPDAAVRIARSEGLGKYVGDGGSSYGPFQLHYGNVAGGGNAVGGLGDTFTKQTGLDARDPATVPQQIDFALKNAAQGGWGPWHGRKTAQMGVWDGIGGKGTTTAAADAPAANAHPVASDTLPPGVTPDMVGSPPASDGSLRGDLLAAAAQHGMQPDGPALSGAVTASGVPHELAAGAGARADSGVGAGIGGGPSNTIRPSSGSGSQVTSPAAAPSLRDALTAAMNGGGSGAPAVPNPPPGPAPTSAAPLVVPGPGSAPTPDLSTSADQDSMAGGAGGDDLRSTLMAAAAQQNGGSPYGAPPSAVPPSVGASAASGADLSPNGALLAAMGVNGVDPTLAPQVQGGAPSAPPAAGLSSDNLPGMDNFMNGGGSPNGAITASPNQDAGYTGGFSDPTQSAMNGRLFAAPAPLGGPDQGTPPPAVADASASPTPASPAAPGAPMPIMAQAASNPPAVVAGDLSAPPGVGSGPAPASTQNAGGMTPDQRAMLAKTIVPDAPAPGAVDAGPAPIPAGVAAAMSSAPQPLGLPGDGGADPSSARNFMLAEAMRNQGAPAAPRDPQALVAAMNGSAAPAPAAPAPAAPQSAPTGLNAIGQPGGNPLSGIPILGSIFGGDQQGGQAPAGGAPAMGNPMAAAPAPQGGAPAAPAPAMGGQGGAPQQGAQPDAFAQGMAVMNNAYASPELKSMVAQRLFPQMSVQKMDDGTLLGVMPNGQTRVLYQGAKPVALKPGEQLRNPTTGAPIGAAQDEPDKFAAGPDGSILNRATGSTAPDPNGFKIVDIDAGNGVKVPARVGRNPDGSPNVQILLPGANGAPPAGGAPAPAQGGPISFNGQPSGTPPAPAGGAPGASPSAAPAGAPSPLGPQVQSLVDRAGAQQVQQAGAKASAEANAKNDVDEIAASRTKLEALRGSGQDLAQAQAALNAYKGKMPTGPFGQNALWAQGVANYFGLADQNQLSNMETFAKVATKASAAQIKEFTSKGTNLDLETELKNNPGVSVSDQTNRILIDHGMRTNAVSQQHEQAKQAYYDQNGSLKGFQQQWEHSISGANAIPLSRFPLMTKTINGQTFQKYLSTDPSGYSWHPAGEVQ